MLQQNLYNENNRYIKWLVKTKNQFLDLDLIVIGILLVESLVLYDIKYSTILVSLVVIGFDFLLGLKWKSYVI